MSLRIKMSEDGYNQASFEISEHFFISIYIILSVFIINAYKQ